MAQWSLYSAMIDPGTDLVLNQLTGCEVQPNVRLEEYVLPGAVDRACNVVISGEPKVMLRTHDLATLLGSGGVSLTIGLNCTSGGVFRFQKRDMQVTAGAFASGSVHRTVSSTVGWAAVSSISAQQDQLAEARVDYWALSSDGLTVPLASNTSVGLSSAPAVNSLFTLGPVKLGSSFLEGVVGVELSPGLNYQTRRVNGATFATEGKLVDRKPSLSLRFDNPEAVDSVGSLFHANLGASLYIWLRHVDPTLANGRYANAATSHILFTIAAGSWRPDQISGSGLDDVTLTVPVLPIGTISTSVASAIA